MRMINLLNVLTPTKRKQENVRIANDNRFNKIQAIANEFSAYSPEKIQEKIALAENALLTAPFWRRREMTIFTEALYRAQNLINSRVRLYQKGCMLERSPLVLIKKKAA